MEVFLLILIFCKKLLRLECNNLKIMTQKTKKYLLYFAGALAAVLIFFYNLVQYALLALFAVAILMLLFGNKADKYSRILAILILVWIPISWFVDVILRGSFATFLILVVVGSAILAKISFNMRTRSLKIG